MNSKPKSKNTADTSYRWIRWLAWSSVCVVFAHPLIFLANDFYLFRHEPINYKPDLVPGSYSLLTETRAGNPLVYFALTEKEEKLVVKEIKRASLRANVSSWCKLVHEYLLLKEVQGLPVTKLLGKREQDAFCVEYIPFIDKSILNSAQRQAFKKELLEIFDALHAKRIYHLDLNNQHNIVLTEDFKCYIIDFGDAVQLDHVLNAVVGPFLLYNDYMRLLRGLFRIHPDLLSAEECKQLLLYCRAKQLLLLGRQNALYKRIKSYYETHHI